MKGGIEKWQKDRCAGTGDDVLLLVKAGLTPSGVWTYVCRRCGKGVMGRPNGRLKEHPVGTRPQRLAAEELYRRQAQR